MGRLIVARARAARAPAARRRRARRTITFSGATPTGAVVADLAYFYRHEVRRPPRFSIVGGGTGTGIADAARGIVDAGLAQPRRSAPSDPRGLVVTPFALSGVCLVTNVANPRAEPHPRRSCRTSWPAAPTSWSQVPGAPRTDAITPVALDPSGGARGVFQSSSSTSATPVAYAAAHVPRRRPRCATSSRPRRPPGATSTSCSPAGCTPCPTRACPARARRSCSGAYPARRPLGFVTRGRPRGRAGPLRALGHTQRRSRAGSSPRRYVLPG